MLSSHAVDAKGQTSPLTTCISAICKDDTGADAIILCADTRISIPQFTGANIGFKLSWATAGIPCLISDDPSLAKQLLDVFWETFDPIAITHSTLLDELRKPPQIQKRKLIDEYLRLTWSVTRDDYLAGGLNYLPADHLAEVARQVSSIGLSCELILATFLTKEARIFVVNESGYVREQDQFASIGSGSNIVLSNLYQRQYRRDFSLLEAMYVVYESKKLSEAEAHVGKDTTMYIFRPEEGKARFVSYGGFSVLDYCFATFGPRKFDPQHVVGSPELFDAEVSLAFAEAARAKQNIVKGK